MKTRNRFPLVSIITPTTKDREQYMDNLQSIVAAQDYPCKEHIICDIEDKSIGEKRNLCCRAANGAIILHMDSDDYYSPDWVSKSVMALLSSDADVVGLSVADFYNVDTKETWRYSYPEHSNLHGATLCYYKEVAIKNPFPKISEGEDSAFTRGKKLHSHGYIGGFTATTHGGNTSKRNTTGERWRLISS